MKSGMLSNFSEAHLPQNNIYPGLPLWLICKESTCNAGDLGLIPGLGRSPGEGKGYPFQYSGLENSMESQRVWT